MSNGGALMRHWLRRAFIPGVAALAALIGLLLLVRGDLSSLTTDLIGLGGDPYQTLWRFSALTERFADRTFSAAREPFRNFGPLPWLPVHLLAGEPLGYNLVWLFQGPLTVLSVFWLGRRLGIAALPSSLAGLLVAFAPYRLAQGLGHFGAMQVFWIPASLAAFHRWLAAPSLSRTLVAALLLIGTAWTEHTLFLTTLIALAVMSVSCWQTLVAVWRSRQGRAWSLALLVGLTLGGILPFTQELATTISPNTPLNPGVAQRRRFAPTPSSLFSLAPFHALRRSPDPYGTPRSTRADTVHTVSLVAVIVTALQARKGHRVVPTSSLTLLTLFALTGLALATLPQSGLGARLYDGLPILSSLRAVNRFMVLTVIALPLLVALVFPKRWWARTMVSVLLVLELLPTTYPRQVGTVPSYAAAVRDLPPGHVLEAGSASDYLLASHALYASTKHHRPVIGHAAFARVEPLGARGALLRLPGVRDLLLLRVADLLRPTFFGQPITDLLVPSLQSEHIAGVLLRETVVGERVVGQTTRGVSSLPPEDMAAVRGVLRASGLTETSLEQHTSLFTVPRGTSEPSFLIAIRGAGWERISRRTDGTVQAAIPAAAKVTVRVHGSSPVGAALAFTVAAGRPAASLSVRGPVLTRQVPAPPGRRVALSLGTLSPGDHDFVILVDAPGVIIENPTVSWSPA